MNVSANSAWRKGVLIAAGLLLVAAPLVVFLRANGYLNGSEFALLPTFPIDDGYIYSNYARHAAAGRWFAYQDVGDERSGGVTSLLWYLLLTPTYWLIAQLLPSLGVAGGLQLAAYLLGGLLLAASAGLMFALSGLLLVPLLPTALAGLRPLVLGLPPLLLLLLTPQATWAALSGLELPLSICLVLAALYTFLRAVLVGDAPGWGAAMFAGLLAWARPELAAVAVLLAAITLVLAARHRGWRGALRYILVIALLGVLLLLIYWLGTGRPLPSSFYAKSGQLAIFSPRFFQAIIQLWADGGWPFIALFGAAILTGGLALFSARPQARGLSLVAAVLTLHTLATSAATVWYGQMERYLLPVFPLALLLAAALPMLMISFIRFSGKQQGHDISRRYIVASWGLLVVLIVAGLLLTRDAASGYAIQARNIADAHIAPARWLAANAPAAALVATEPVGALGLFSNRATFDLVGLTSPPMLGYYRDWGYTWQQLRTRRVAYLLYYPQWFKDQRITPPAWLTPAVRFAIPDNRIAGASEIVLYKVDDK